MKARFHLCLWVAALLVSCDKPQHSGNPAAARESKPRIAHAPKPTPERSVIPPQELRENLGTALKIESPEERDQALAEVVLDALESEPEIAAAAFKQISTDSEAKLPLIQQYAMKWVEQDPQKALAWADSLGSEKEIAAANGMIVHSLHESDLEGAAKYLAKSGLASAEPESPLMYVFQRWTSDAPADAAAWVATFPVGESRSTGIGTVASRWVVTDPEAALSWMAALTNEADRKGATHAMAEAIAKQPPEARESLLEPADPTIRADLEQQLNQIKQEQEKASPPPDAESE